MPDGEVNIGRDSVGIGKLAKALAAAQGAIKGAAKDAENPAFKRDGANTKYADLTAVWAACREALSKNEIAVIQSPQLYQDGQLVLHTTLVHSSGESTTGHFPIRPVQNTPQGLGSAMTYARRYSLASMVGVAPEGEDDDGNAGSEGTPAKTNGATKDTSPPAQVKKPLVPEPSAAQKPGITKWVNEQIQAIGDCTSMDMLLAWESETDKTGATNLQRMNRLQSEVWSLEGNRLKGEYLNRQAVLNPANGD